MERAGWVIASTVLSLSPQGGERRTLRLVARYADMWNGVGDLPTIRRKLEVLEDHCRDAGRDPAGIVKTRLGTLLIAPTMDEAKQRLAALSMPEERRKQPHQRTRRPAEAHLRTANEVPDHPGR